jgi:hypothetical protein
MADRRPLRRQNELLGKMQRSVTVEKAEPRPRVSMLYYRSPTQKITRSTG